MKLTKLVVALFTVIGVSVAQASTYRDSDATFFSLSSTADVTVDFSWQDLVFDPADTKHHVKPEREFDGKYKLSLFEVVRGRDPLVGSVSFDGASASNSTDAYTFSDLARGTYKIVFNGKWSGVPNRGDVLVSPDVRIDALRVIAVVPEPETYAMFLAGLGMIGFIARRRRSA
jgi:hypothetical protein